MGICGILLSSTWIILDAFRLSRGDLVAAAVFEALEARAVGRAQRVGR